MADPNDWIEMVKSIPGAVKAIAEIVGEIGNCATAWTHVGTAKARQISGEIEAKTDSQRRIIHAEGDAEVARIRAHSENSLISRAQEHQLRLEAKQQSNREHVALIAVNGLVDDPPPEVPNGEPSDDWLNLFSSYAERASSQTMREHWGRILEKEIRNPGSFSFVTLQMASLLDSKLAEDIKEVLSYCMEKKAILGLPKLSNGEGFQRIVNLSSIGFLELFRVSNHFFIPQNTSIITIEGHSFEVERKVQTKKNYELPIWMLTTAGRELSRVIDIDIAADFGESVLDLLVREGFKAKYLGPPVAKNSSDVSASH